MSSSSTRQPSSSKANRYQLIPPPTAFLFTTVHSSTWRLRMYYGNILNVSRNTAKADIFSITEGRTVNFSNEYDSLRIEDLTLRYTIGQKVICYVQDEHPSVASLVCPIDEMRSEHINCQVVDNSRVSWNAVSDQNEAEISIYDIRIVTSVWRSKPKVLNGQFLLMPIWRSAIIMANKAKTQKKCMTANEYRTFKREISNKSPSHSSPSLAYRECGFQSLLHNSRQPPCSNKKPPPPPLMTKPIDRAALKVGQILQPQPCATKKGSSSSSTSGEGCPIENPKNLKVKDDTKPIAKSLKTPEKSAPSCNSSNKLNENLTKMQPPKRRDIGVMTLLDNETLVETNSSFTQTDNDQLSKTEALNKDILNFCTSDADLFDKFPKELQQRIMMHLLNK